MDTDKVHSCFLYISVSPVVLCSSVALARNDSNSASLFNNL